MARPTIFDRAIFDQICERLADGETLRQVCRDENQPSATSVRRWVMEDRDGVSAQYARARQLGIEAMMDENLDIADDGSNDWIERKRRDGSVEIVLDREHVERSKLRIGQRNWLAARIVRHLYGDKPKDEGADTNNVTITGGLPE